jgi:DNA-directed RNA polymerase subunit F
MVGYLFSTDLMFMRDGFTGVESHFGVGGIWGSDKVRGLDGVAYQWQDLAFRADANLEGNHRVISIETADNAPKFAKDIVRWTPNQADKIVDLIATLCKLYNIPAKLIPDTKPGRRGLAYHAQGIAPNLVPGGEKWSAARGKECPGDVRIKQFKEEIIPAVQKKLNPPEEFVMASKDEVKDALEELLEEKFASRAFVNKFAEKLFTADVIGAPPEVVAADPKNPTWRLDTFLNKLFTATKKETPDA